MIHSLSGIRNLDPRIRASEYSSRLRPRGHCERQGKRDIKQAKDRVPTGALIKILSLEPSCDIIDFLKEMMRQKGYE